MTDIIILMVLLSPFWLAAAAVLFDPFTGFDDPW